MGRAEVHLMTEFLGTHPATAAWHAQRSKCASCAHVSGKAPAMRCKLAPRPQGTVTYCIDMRESGSCGPSARLWKKVSRLP